MSEAFLNEGAVSFAAANWSDAIGFTTDAQLVVDKTFGRITEELNKSTINIDKLEFSRTAIGTVGGDGAGNLRVGIASTGDSYLGVHGFVELYYEVPAGFTCNNTDVSNGKVYNQGGNTINYTHSGGYGEINASAVVTNVYIYGGSGIIHHNATKMTNLFIYGGQWVVKRGATNIFIGDRANVVLDFDDATNFSGTSLKSQGGNIDLRYAPIPTVEAQGGSLNFRQARRNYTFGGTQLLVGGSRITESASVDLSNITYPGALGRSRTTGNFEAAGGFSPL